ncbi:MAG: hypothetical protein EXR73_05785 [Myxococcales bacterium]|nr:hypothetical protein [Myxococcales bacterium]
MNRASKITVVLRTAARERVAEALRAAVGLTLRGAEVSVVRCFVVDARDARTARALATLVALGHEVDAPAWAIGAADVVEVWT